MKIIIFGLGKIFKENESNIDINDVVCFMDNGTSLLYSNLFGKPVLPPFRIQEFSFDYVVIFNQKNSKDIHDQLLELGIADKKIISWQYYLYFLKWSIRSCSRDCLRILPTLFSQFSFKRVLDINGGMVENCFHVNMAHLIDKLDIVDNYEFSKHEKTFYRNRLLTLETSEYYDAITFFDFFRNYDVNTFLQIFKKSFQLSRYVIVSIPYPYPEPFTEWAEFDYSQLGKVKIFLCKTVKLIIIDKKKEIEHKDIAIYTVTHKVFSPIQNSLYIPIFAGKDNNNEMNIQGDATGDNIAELNSIINECTTLYWIWKNTKQKYIGLCHYRRYFSLGLENSLDDFGILDDQYIDQYLEDCDMIVAEAVTTYPFSIKDRLKLNVCKEAFEQGYTLVRNIIKQKYPEYIDDFDIFFERDILYPCNMFIASREIMDKYCNWLFDIIIDASRAIDVSKFDIYSRRIIGFMAERLLTLWIVHNGIKVKEVPIIMKNFEE